jgi:hypothetical protein
VKRRYKERCREKKKQRREREEKENREEHTEREREWEKKKSVSEEIKMLECEEYFMKLLEGKKEKGSI